MDDRVAKRTVGPMAATQLDPGQRVIQPLNVIGNDSPESIADSLGELIDHYATTISSMPPMTERGAPGAEHVVPRRNMDLIL
jgi:hypothetical protein